MPARFQKQCSFCRLLYAKQKKQNKTKNNENRQRNAQQHSFRVQQLAKRNFYEDEIALQYLVDYMKILILLYVPLY